MSAEEAAGHFGWFGLFVGTDLATSSEQARALLGWEPKQPRLIPDLEMARCFEN
jgi:hypothetical protein